MKANIYEWQRNVDKNFYNMDNWVTTTPQNDRFRLHWHDEYEILLFLRGDAHYIVEDKTYPLKPMDIILIRKHEMHRIYHNSNTPYQRCVLMISPNFFQKYHCQEFESQFLNTTPGMYNKIPGEIVLSSGLYKAFERYKEYKNIHHVPLDSPLLSAIVIEILYLLNVNAKFEKSIHTNKTIESIILYLNNNYTDDISLDALSEKFHLSKYHLCREFRKATGLSTHEYICQKRLAYVRELRNNGSNLNVAALDAGFSDYSSFYRAYVKKYGMSPRKGL